MVRSISSRLRRVGVIGAISAFLLLASVAVATSTPSKTTTVAKKAVITYAPHKSPVDVAGHRDVRKGKALPKGTAIVARGITVTRGKGSSKSANAVLMTCPGTRTIAGVGPGRANFKTSEVYGRKTGKLYPDAYDSKGKLLPVGKSATDTLYVLCR